MAIWAADIVACLLVILLIQSLFYLNLALLAEELIAPFTLQRTEGEIAAHAALDLIYHFPLQFVLDFGDLDVQLRDGLWPHYSLDGLIRNRHV